MLSALADRHPLKESTATRRRSRPRTEWPFSCFHLEHDQTRRSKVFTECHQIRDRSGRGLNIAYREAGDPSDPKLVLLHGFPSSSHQYRNLIPALADRFHVLSPDYPGFGNSDLPDPAAFAYTFDKISEIAEAFLKLKGFDRYGLFVQDYGGPVGFRIVSRHPEALEWLIIQNTNAYEIGFTPAWDGFRNALWKNCTPETEKPPYGISRTRRH